MPASGTRRAAAAHTTSDTARLSDVEALGRLSEAMGGAMQAVEVLERALGVVVDHLGAAAGMCFLLDEESGQLLPAAALAAEPGLSPSLERLAEQSIERFRNGQGNAWLSDLEPPGRGSPDPSENPPGLVMAAACLAGRDSLFGVIVLAAAEGVPGGWGRDQQAFLGTASRQIGMAIEYARLFETERRRREQAEALRAAGTVLASSLDLDALLGVILEQLGRVVPYDSSAIFLLEDDELLIMASRGFESFTPGRRLNWETYSLLGDVALSRQPLRVADVRRDPRWRSSARTAAVRSWLGIPLVHNDDLVGFLTLDKHLVGWYSADHAELAAAFAAQAAAAVKNAELFRRSLQHLASLETLYSRLEAIYRVAQTLSSTVELQTVIETVVQSATAQTSFPMAAVVLMQPPTLTFDCVASVGVDESFQRRLRGVPMNSPYLRGSALEQAMRSQQPTVVENADTSPLALPARWLTSQAGLRSYVCVPLIAKGRFEGALFVFDSKPRPDAANDLSHLAALADQAAVAIANARLYESMDESLRQTRALQRITAALASSLDLAELLGQALSAAMQLFGADRAAVFMFNRETGVNDCLSSLGLSQAYLEAVHGRYRGAPGSGAAETEGHRYVTDALEDPFMAPLREAVQREGFRSVLFVALHYHGERTGTFVLYHDSVRAYSETETGLAKTFGDQAAIAIEHARLFEQTGRLAAVEERNRLARELHDSVTQSLFSISLMAQALPELIERNPPRARERVDRLGDLARGALAEMRSLIFELRPAALVEEGLVEALRKYTAAFQSREQVAVTLETSAERRLPIETEEGLFRIVQEALNNVAKHARATSVTITLRFMQQQVALVVRDDGAGFDPTRVAGDRRGFGMTSMRERTALLGGTFVLESAPGRGTELRVEVPDPAAAAGSPGQQ